MPGETFEARPKIKLGMTAIRAYKTRADGTKVQKNLSERQRRLAIAAARERKSNISAPIVAERQGKPKSSRNSDGKVIRVVLNLQDGTISNADIKLK